MKAADFPESSEAPRPAAANGEQKRAKRNGVATSAPAEAAAPEPLAGPIVSPDAAANGEHRPAKRNGVAKRAAAASGLADALAKEPLAGPIAGMDAAANGEHRPAKRNGVATRTAVASAPINAPALEPLAGPIAGMDAAAIDAPMWPIQSAVWFQPDVAPAAPLWSGLAIERHNRLPAPDFLPCDMCPVNRTDAPENAVHVLDAASAPAVPESGLEPLGWDPRAICWKEKGA